MELTKHNLRLLIFEDVLYYHAECRSLIQPSLASTTAPTTPAPPGQPNAPTPDAGNGITSSGPVTAPSAAEPAAGSDPVTNSSPPPPRAVNGGTVAAREEKGPEGAPAWPPNEAAAGTARWTEVDNAVALAGVSKEASGNGDGDVAPSVGLVTAV